MQFPERKNPYLPHGRSLEISRGRGVLPVNAKILEAKFEAKLEFFREGVGGGGGCKTKNPS